MFKAVIVLGYAIIVFAILLIVGSAVLGKINTSQAVCATDYTYNETQDKCVNASNGDPTTPSGSAYTSGSYMLTQLGSSSGLASWTPAIIAVGIGFLFLGYFGFGNKKGY